MTEKEKMLNNYLLRIASNLDISETMREKAETSYRAVGQWLGDCDDDSEVKIMPQGSFYLGTVIRPVSDADEYDIDLDQIKHLNDNDRNEILSRFSWDETAKMWMKLFKEL